MAGNRCIMVPVLIAIAVVIAAISPTCQAFLIALNTNPKPYPKTMLEKDLVVCTEAEALARTKECHAVVIIRNTTAKDWPTPEEFSKAVDRILNPNATEVKMMMDAVRPLLDMMRSIRGLMG